MTATALRALHDGPKPLILFNAWDAASAMAIAQAGAPAIATSSWAVAAAQGYRDGEELPFDALVALTTRLCALTSLPVSVDMETGYGDIASAVGANARTLAACGAAGINLEDRDHSGAGLMPVEDAAARIAAIREALVQEGRDLFINARCDAFFSAGKEAQASPQARLEAALHRAEAYLAAGADGIFLPGLTDPRQVAHAAQAIPAPLNVMVADAGAVPALREAGARRISFGPAPHIAAMTRLGEAASLAFAA